MWWGQAQPGSRRPQLSRLGAVLEERPALADPRPQRLGCVVRVLRGTLTETLFELAPNGHVKATFSRDFAEGSLIGSEDTDIHQVSNLQAGDADLVTLHVYSPPLTRMNTYSLYDLSRGYEVWDPEFSDAAGI